MNEPTFERLPDIWFTLDYRVLVEAARWETADRPGWLPVEAIAKRIDEPVERALGALLRLDGEYIEIKVERGGGRVTHAVVVAVLPAGLRETGPWHKPENLATALHDVLEAQVRLLERLEPERGHKARKAAELFLGVGTDFTSKVAAELIKAYVPVPPVGP